MTEGNSDLFQGMQVRTAALPDHLLHYGVALLSVVLALGTTLLLGSYLETTLTSLFFVAVMVSAWYGGLKPGIFATVLSTLAINYFLIEPIHVLSISDLGTLVRLGVFVMAAILISSLNAAQRLAQKRAEVNFKSLRESEARFGCLAESNIIGMMVAELSGGILEANDAFLQMVGYTQEELRSRRLRWNEMTPPEFLEVSNQAVQELITTGACSPFEKEYVRKDGSRVPVLHGAIMTGETTVTGFVLDLSERKRAEETLQRTNQTLQTVLDACPVAIAFFDPQGIVRVWNRAAEQIFGWSAAEAIGQFMPTVPHRRQEFLASIQTVLSGRSLNGFEAQHQHKDGHMVDLEIWANLAHDAEGNPGCLGIAWDITDRKQVEATLHQSEARFQVLVSNMPGMVYRYAPGADGAPAFTYISSGSRELVELEPETILQDADSFFRLVHPDDLPSFQNSVAIAIENSAVWQWEGRIITPSGQLKWIQGRSRPQETEYGEAWDGLLFDITDRKQAEEALRQSEERLRVALKSSPITVFNQDQELRYTWIYNPAFGHRVPEVIGKQDQDLLPEDDAAILTRIKRHVLETGSGVREEVKLTMHNRDFYYDLAVEPLQTEDGETIGVTCASMDITERKQMELALQQSETTLNALIASSPIGIAFFDRDLRYIHANEALAATNGIPLHEHMGRTLWDVLPQWAPVITPVLQQVMDTQEPLLNQEIVGATYPSDRVRYALVNYFPVCLTNGKVLGVGVTSVDISDRKQAEEALRNSAERLSLALTAAKLGDWSWNAATDIVTFSEQAAEMFGIPPGPYMTWTQMQDLLHPDDRTQARLQVEQAIAEHSDYDVEYRIIHPDNTERWIAAKGRAQYDPLGQVLGMLGVVQDVSDRKQAEVEREQLLVREKTAREEAETANRIKDEFLAVLSHELRSPLNPILGWSRLLQTQKLDEQKTQAALATIERNAKLQTQLIEDLLDVSRILRGKLVLNIAPVSLSNLIEAALETVRLAVEAKAINLRFEVSGGVDEYESGRVDGNSRPIHPSTHPHIQVMGDAARLQQVIWNLLTNAVKFTPSGGTVEIRLERSNNQVQIQVKDTGKGIRSDFLPYAFDYFRQEDGTTTRKFGGLGLGLAIVRHITELHGGTVWAESPGEGMGATFTVQLPLMSIPVKVDEKGEPSTSANLSGLRVLAVDDDEDIRELLEFILQQAGAEVRVVASATEALQQLEIFSPKILISDVGMPDIDGYMLIRQIRTLAPERGTILAIALTAYAGEIDQQQAIAAGFQMHLAKPVDPEQLISVIGNLLKENSISEL